ncbi:hypothetical protein CY34DRAFT_199691 [Suillus luteus UH-Slu-Lm8-n1]|uniref:Secreted protein n=1 Tax=Suillus luteus UH-Slu-Lm8-n1 TaxID=930992 RepID=A0A0C9ZUL2_9AGAM|nr:hypothetical protein CY34DRAFT_199691 [Suillus luteus UH-Slu-Lm8-n1]
MKERALAAPLFLSNAAAFLSTCQICDRRGTTLNKSSGLRLWSVVLKVLFHNDIKRCGCGKAIANARKATISNRK